MSCYHPNADALTEEERRALDEKRRMSEEIYKSGYWMPVKSRLSKAVLHSGSVVSNVAAGKEVATTVKSVPEFLVDPPGAAPPGAAPAAAPVAAPGGAAAAAVEPGLGAAALEPKLGLLAE